MLREVAPGWTGSIQAIGLDPMNDQTVYVGGSLDPGAPGGGRLLKTTNGGAAWVDITGAITAGRIDQIEVAAGDPRVVVVRAGSSLFTSADGGSNWSDITPAGGVSAVRVNPDQAGEIYAAVPEDVVVSEDGGTQWTSIGAGIGTYPVQSIDLSLCVKTVYVGTSGGGVYQNRTEPKYVVVIGPSDAGKTVPPPGSYGCEEGATLDIWAVPAAGYAFAAWTGDATGPDNPLRLTVNSDLTISPTFRLAAPTGFSAVQIETRSLLMRQYINILTWQKLAVVPPPTAYKLYLLGDGPPTHLASLDQRTLSYWHRGVVKGRAYRYGLAAVGAGGAEGELAITEIGASPPDPRRPAKATQDRSKLGRLRK